MIKCHHTHNRDHYRPITLTNYMFKVITKVLVGRIVTIFPNIIYSQQRCFIKGLLSCFIINPLEEILGRKLTLKRFLILLIGDS